jgi:hypothetical protein
MKEEERLRATEESQNPKWKSRKRGDILISSMDDDHLQRALLYAQRRELYYFNIMQTFTTKIEQLEEEAAKRGIKLKDLDQVSSHVGNFHKNKREYVEKSKQK